MLLLSDLEQYPSSNLELPPAEASHTAEARTKPGRAEVRNRIHWVRRVGQVINLTTKLQLDVLVYGEVFEQRRAVREEVRTTYCVPAEIAERSRRRRRELICVKVEEPFSGEPFTDVDPVKFAGTPVTPKHWQASESAVTV